MFECASDRCDSKAARKATLTEIAPKRSLGDPVDGLKANPDGKKSHFRLSLSGGGMGAWLTDSRGRSFSL